jgi:hypothetical protein
MVGDLLEDSGNMRRMLSNTIRFGVFQITQSTSEWTMLQIETLQDYWLTCSASQAALAEAAITVQRRTK